jgi:6-methylsalicylate decarboxylase
MGGSTPLLAARVSVLSPHMGCRLSPDEILADFRSFYYDTALSGYETNLVALESFLGGEVSRILFGTDFPGK